MCLQCGHCVHHKGILSHPSWSYQSLAELRGVRKVIHTTGGSSPHCRLPTAPIALSFRLLAGLKRQCGASFFSFWFLVSCVCVFCVSRGQRSLSQSQDCTDISFLLHCKTDREEGLHRMSPTSSLSPWLLVSSCRAGSLCFITVRRLS